MAEISLGAVLTATFTAAQCAITTISRYRAAPSELQAVGREVASFKALIRQIQRISTSTSRQGIRLNDDFAQVLEAAKIELNELIRYLNRHRQLTALDRFQIDVIELNNRRLRLQSHSSHINGLLSTLTLETLGRSAFIQVGRAERRESNALRERQELIRLVENVVSSRSDYLRGIEEELHQEGYPVDRIPLCRDRIKNSIRDLIRNESPPNPPVPSTTPSRSDSGDAELEETTQLRYAIFASLEDAAIAAEQTTIEFQQMNAAISESIEAQATAVLETGTIGRSEEEQYLSFIYDEMIEQELAASIVESNAQLRAIGLTNEEIRQHRAAVQRVTDQQTTISSVSQDRTEAVDGTALLQAMGFTEEEICQHQIAEQQVVEQQITAGLAPSQDRAEALDVDTQLQAMGFTEEEICQHRIAEQQVVQKQATERQVAEQHVVAGPAPRQHDAEAPDIDAQLRAMGFTEEEIFQHRIVDQQITERQVTGQRVVTSLASSQDEAETPDIDVQLRAMGFTEEEICQHRIAEQQAVEQQATVQRVVERQVTTVSIPRNNSVESRNRPASLPLARSSNAGAVRLTIRTLHAEGLAISHGGFRCCQVQDSDGTFRIIYIDLLCGLYGRKIFLHPPILEDSHSVRDNLPSGWSKATTRAGRVYYVHTHLGFRTYQHPAQNNRFAQRGKMIWPKLSDAERNRNSSVITGRWILDDPDAKLKLELQRGAEAALGVDPVDLIGGWSGFKAVGLLELQPPNPIRIGGRKG
ncbi:hypothetical protein AOQ84DRAFT_227542 [Glonium stellatum]|uniref:WW domain-containing protein n=1 Tax=Glonium stellatum TaxID=574774 RepID=A0A8E2JX85_9PEZI|nr:hypothetical protein AOQ84DRAFT_227542 [Glonium stellatum]